MIELPRARLARQGSWPKRERRRVLLVRHQRSHADGMGLSRDDAAPILPQLFRTRHLRYRPVRLHRPGRRGRARAHRRRARQKRQAKLKLGICGEHGGDPASVEFFPPAGLRLCLLLAVSRSDRASRRRSGWRSESATPPTTTPDGFGPYGRRARHCVVRLQLRGTSRARGRAGRAWAAADAVPGAWAERAAKSTSGGTRKHHAIQKERSRFLTPARKPASTDAAIAAAPQDNDAVQHGERSSSSLAPRSTRAGGTPAASPRASIT